MSSFQAGALRARLTAREENSFISYMSEVCNFGDESESAYYT
jgi:hypothetical protein